MRSDSILIIYDMSTINDKCGGILGGVDFFIFIQNLLDKMYNYAKIRYIIQRKRMDECMAINDSFLKEIDFTKEERVELIDLGLKFKELKKKRIPHKYLEGLNIALIFEKTSTRTRSAFTVAGQDLGMNVTYLGSSEIQLGKKESVIDTAKVLGSMFDGIEYRGFKQEDVEALAEYSGVPVWNGLTDTWHPTQMIADFMTLKEVFGKLEGLTIAYVGDGRNNMANSLLVTSAILGVNVKIIAPASLQPEAEIIEIAQKYNNGAELTITDDLAAVKGVDMLYTDVWVSMGEKVDFKKRIDLLLPYQINAELLAKTENPDVIVMHCLPAFHDLNTEIGQEIYDKYGLAELEITDEIFQKYSSIIFQEAENRMHSIKAIMYNSLKAI